MKRLKIIHILKGKANPDTMNGVNKVVHWLATTQQQQGMDVQVWGITDTPDKISHTHNYPLRLFKARAWRFGICAGLKAAIASAPKDTIFHLHSVFLPELYAVSRALKKYGLCWVISPHGGYAPASMKKNHLAKSIYSILFEDRIIRDSKAIHALGKHGEADQFTSPHLKRKVFIVPNGHIPSDEKRLATSDKDPLALCFCGRLAVRQKGLDLLLEAIKLTLNNGIDTHLDLIGDGSERAELESQARALEITHAVTFHGMKVGHEKDQLLKSADVFVHTSRWDGIPMAALEAAGIGLPLLVTPQTNMADYVLENHAGYIIANPSPNDIASGIAIAAQDKKNGRLASKGEAARSMIFSKFSWENISHMLYEKIYLPISMAKHETI